MPPTNTPTSFPAGSVVFIPDGEPRIPKRGIDWMRPKVGGDEMIKLTDWEYENPRQCYRRIDLSEPTHVVSGAYLRAIAYLINDQGTNGERECVECGEFVAWDKHTNPCICKKCVLRRIDISTPAPVVTTPEKTVRGQVEDLLDDNNHTEALRRLADRLDAIEARMKEGGSHDHHTDDADGE